MSSNINKVRNAFVAFTKAKEDSGLDFTFGNRRVDDPQNWVREGPHHSVVLKNVIGRIANGLNYLSEAYGNNTQGTKFAFFTNLRYRKFEIS